MGPWNKLFGELIDFVLTMEITPYILDIDFHYYLHIPWLLESRLPLCLEPHYVC